MSPNTIILVEWILTGLIAFTFIFNAYLKLFVDGLEIQKNASTFGLSTASFRLLGLFDLICMALFTPTTIRFPESSSRIFVKII